MNREGIIEKVKINLDEVTPPGVDLPFDSLIGPTLDECAKEVAKVSPLHLLSPVSIRTILSSSPWFLPSKDELYAMYQILHLNSLGNFDAAEYWSSSEALFNGDTFAWSLAFDTSTPAESDKSTSLKVRACRSFTAIGTYALKEIGPSGGYIFAISGNTYYESAPADCSDSLWSNIDDIALSEASGMAIGTGLGNTAIIMSQYEHTDSAAKLCHDLVVSTNLTMIFADNKCYIPKPSDFLRLYEIKFPLWQRTVREVQKPGSNACKIIENNYLTSGIGRPTVILQTTMPTGGTLQEYLVCGKVASVATPIALYIKIPVPETLPEQLIDSLVWLCAAKILSISKEFDSAKIAMEQFGNSLTSLSKV